MYILPVSDNTCINEQLEKKVDIELLCLGFRPDLRGFNYIRDAIIMLIDDPDMIYGITKTIYPQVAKKNKTRSSVVEVAIRRSIEFAWESNGTNTLHHFFIHHPERRPTNRTVLAFLFKYVNAEFSASRNLFLIK